ncbi:MAG: glycosyltransferase [Rhodovibrionaceae bacterium]
MTELFFYVQHLHGIGHLRRAAAIVRAAAADGIETLLVSGGFPVPDLDLGGAAFAQLPPLRTADESFSRLVGEDGEEVSVAFKAARRERLLALFAEAAPRILMTEMFPFGRRQLRFELEPLLAAAETAPARPWIVSSVRDLLVVQDNPEKSAWMRDTALAHFDRVIVHGDPSLIAFGESFAHAAELGERLVYSGYVASGGETAAAQQPSGEVLVSIGGGAFGASLARCAIAARPLSALSQAPWRLLLGHNLPPAVFEALKAGAGGGIAVERARPDFPALLRACRLSISQAGYNTAVDLLQAGTPAVLVPFSGGAETEQAARAAKLAAAGLAVVLDEAALSPQALAAAVDRAAALAPARHRLALDGAAETAGLLRRLCAGTPGQASSKSV